MRTVSNVKAISSGIGNQPTRAYLRILRSGAWCFFSYPCAPSNSSSLSVLHPSKIRHVSFSPRLSRSTAASQKCGAIRIATPAMLMLMAATVSCHKNSSSGSSFVSRRASIAWSSLMEARRDYHYTPFLLQQDATPRSLSSIPSFIADDVGRRRESKKTALTTDKKDAASQREPHSKAATFRTLRLHNLPKNWLHEDIIQFIEQVASYAGIDPPPPSSSSHSSSQDASCSFEKREMEEDGETFLSDKSFSPATSAPQHVTSPFVHHLTIYFGRRTGIVFGSPKIVLTSASLCDVLLQGVPFEEDDYRARIYFTEESPSPSPASSSSSPSSVPTSFSTSSSSLPASSSLQAIKETLADEQQAALEQLELDRFLFAPDLLYDVARLHQRRLVTRSESVLLRSFCDSNHGEEEENDEEEEGVDVEEMNGHNEKQSDGTDEDFTHESLPSQRFGMLRRAKAKNKRRRKQKRVTSVIAGEQSDLGRGSMHNTPMPKPYVEGRQI